MLYNIPSSGGVFLAYIVPAYLLAGLHREDAEEPIFSGGSLLGKVFFQYIGTYNRASKLIASTGINDYTKIDIHIFLLVRLHAIVPVLGTNDSTRVNVPDCSFASPSGKFNRSHFCLYVPSRGISCPH